MALKPIALCVVLSLTFSYGAVVPQQEDALFDMVQSFLVQPEEFATSLGMTRVKRSAYDTDLRLSALGVQFQIKYTDPNNHLKGGKAVITIDDLQRLVRQAKSKKVKLSIDFNSGATPKDGLFKMTVDYELHHANVEKGTFTAERKKVGGMWVTDIISKSKNNPAKQLIPCFNINVKSDRQTKLEGTYSCDKGQKYTINVDRTPGKKIKAVIQGAGKTYTIDGDLNMAQKKVNINIDANGQKYTVVLSMVDSADSYVFKADADLKNAGKYMAQLDAKKDRSSAGFQVLFNSRPLVNVKLAGKVDPKTKTKKYETRYSIVGVGEGKLRFSMEVGPKKVLKLQYLPNTGLDLKIYIERELHSDQSRHIKADITRGGEKYVEYKNDIIPTSDAKSYTIKTDSELKLNEKSLVYTAFCNYGCFKSRTMHSTLLVDKATPYKFSLVVDLTKDRTKVLDMEINSRSNPYIFKINAPRILPKILPSGRESIEFEADHKPGQYLKIKSNSNVLKTFTVEKMADNMRRIELNGKELVKAGFTQADKSISQNIILPDGTSLTTTVSWESENLKKNKVNIKLDGTNRKLNADLTWDVTNPSSMIMKADAKGQNARWGKYELNRDIKMSYTGSKVEANWTGNSNFPNAPWPNPVKTDVKISVETRKPAYSIMIKKTMAGSTYGFTLADGNLSLII